MGINLIRQHLLALFGENVEWFVTEEVIKKILARNFLNDWSAHKPAGLVRNVKMMSMIVSQTPVKMKDLVKMI